MNSAAMNNLGYVFGGNINISADCQSFCLVGLGREGVHNALDW